MAVPSPLAPFSATFESDPTPGFQFTFANETGQAISNAFWVAAEGGTVSITLIHGTFSSIPIAWSLPPANVPVIIMTSDEKTITFEVPAPDHYFSPWIFRIVVDADGINAVRSQNIYLVKETELNGATFSLKYSAINGSFSLLDDSSDSSQAGVVLADILTLINVVVPPPEDQFTFTVTLDPTGPFSEPPIFSSVPVIWGTLESEPPNWISASRLSDKVVELTLLHGAVGQSIGIQFSVEVKNPGGESITVLSPDPIIMNATIGDG